MNATETKTYRALASQSERADWLLKKGVTAELTIDPEKLAPAYQAKSAGVALPGYFDSEEMAIEESTKWLQSLSNTEGRRAPQTNE
jgi:hypothetical protein